MIFYLELKKKRTFRKFSYRGIDLDQYVPPFLRHLSLISLGFSTALTNTLILFQDYSISPPNSSAMSSMRVPAVDSTAASSENLWV